MMVRRAFPNAFGNAFGRGFGSALRNALRTAGTVTVLAVAVAGCRQDFNPRLYTNPEQLFDVGIQLYNDGKWGNAVKAFEQLTRDLPTRDPLLPTAYFYLAMSQSQNGDHLLSAQSYQRISEAFPEDTLAPTSLYQAGYEYSRMWRKPELDAQYGTHAQNTLNTLFALYPESKYEDEAKTLMAKINNMFATKDFKTGYSYFRRHAYDSAILYFKDVIRLHPDTPAARDAYLYLYESYQKINYRDDAAETCQAMQMLYPDDKEVRQKCGSGSSAEASTPPT